MIYFTFMCYLTYVVVNEALLLLNISNGGSNRDVMRQLIKVTEGKKGFICMTQQ